MFKMISKTLNLATKNNKNQELLHFTSKCSTTIYFLNDEKGLES